MWGWIEGGGFCSDFVDRSAMWIRIPKKFKNSLWFIKRNGGENNRLEIGENHPAINHVMMIYRSDFLKHLEKTSNQDQNSHYLLASAGTCYLLMSTRFLASTSIGSPAYRHDKYKKKQCTSTVSESQKKLSDG